jgi:hypothetical protein
VNSLPIHDYSLARANGCDQPVRARGIHDPKTPAAGKRVVWGRPCQRVDLGASARETQQQGSREVAA